MGPSWRTPRWRPASLGCGRRGSSGGRRSRARGGKRYVYESIDFERRYLEGILKGVVSLFGEAGVVHLNEELAKLSPGERRDLTAARGAREAGCSLRRSGSTFSPVLVWAATGVGVAWGFRRSGPTLLLRLSATFLALWSLIATTVALYVLSSGGWEAVVRLTRSPASLLVLFGPRESQLWAEGAAGAFVVFLAAFLLNQLVGRGLLGLLEPRPLQWPPALPQPATPTTLVTCRSERAEAFSFTLLELRGSQGLVGRREVIVVSDRLVSLLDAEELEAVVAHELGHVQRLDGRYLTFLRTLSRMMRWDPVLAYLSRALTRREDYADEQAVRFDRPSVAARPRPRQGERAEPGWVLPSPPSPPVDPGPGDDAETAVRIRRLLVMAESRAPMEALGA